MNEIIAQFLAQHYSSLNFISLAAGCVQTIFVQTANNITKKIPGALTVYENSVPNVIDCAKANTYHEITPSSEEIGILYFEDMGARLFRKNSSTDTYTGNLKLVCWLNMNRIGSLNAPGTIQEAVRAHTPTNFSQLGSMVGGKIKITQELPKRPSPFDKYDFDEKKTQFLIYPFDYFSFNLSYVAFVKKQCEVAVNITPEIC